MADPDADAFDVDDAEGWYFDPFGVHECRWISRGRPTDLVRDGTAEAEDPPPDGPPPGPFVKVVADPRSMSRRDMIRADGDKDAVSPDLGYYGVTAMDANVVFDSGLVGAPEAEGALKGGRYGGRRTTNAVRRQTEPASRWAPIAFLLVATVGILLVAIGITEKPPAHQSLGSVVSVTPTGTGNNWVCEVAYSVPGRGSFTIHVLNSPVAGSVDNCGAGQEVTVSYEPGDPSVAHLVANGFAFDFSGGSASDGDLVVTLGALVLAGACAWAIDWWRRRPLSEGGTEGRVTDA
jgi:hypothetical protein